MPIGDNESLLARQHFINTCGPNVPIPPHLNYFRAFPVGYTIGILACALLVAAFYALVLVALYRLAKSNPTFIIFFSHGLTDTAILFCQNYFYFERLDAVKMSNPVRARSAQRGSQAQRVAKVEKQLRRTPLRVLRRVVMSNRSYPQSVHIARLLKDPVPMALFVRVSKLNLIDCVMEIRDLQAFASFLPAKWKYLSPKCRRVMEKQLRRTPPRVLRRVVPSNRSYPQCVDIAFLLKDPVPMALFVRVSKLNLADSVMDLRDLQAFASLLPAAWKHLSLQCRRVMEKQLRRKSPRELRQVVLSNRSYPQCVDFARLLKDFDQMALFARVHKLNLTDCVMDRRDLRAFTSLLPAAWKRLSLQCRRAMKKQLRRTSPQDLRPVVMSNRRYPQNVEATSKSSDAGDGQMGEDGGEVINYENRAGMVNASYRAVEVTACDAQRGYQAQRVAKVKKQPRRTPPRVLRRVVPSNRSYPQCVDIAFLLKPPRVQNPVPVAFFVRVSKLNLIDSVMDLRDIQA